MRLAICGFRKSETMKCIERFAQTPLPPLENAEGRLQPACCAQQFMGFTLIEVLVALAILAIALAAAARAANVATDSAQETRLRTLATWIAQNRVAELTATKVFPSAGTIRGRGSMAGLEFEWRQVTSETPNAAFRKVEITVLRPARAQSLVTLNAYLVRPPGSGS